MRPRHLSGGRFEENRLPFPWRLGLIFGVGDGAFLFGHRRSAFPGPVENRGVVGDNLPFLVILVTWLALSRQLHLDPVLDRDDSRIALPVGLTLFDDLESLPEPIHGLADQLVRGRPELHPALAIRQLTEVWHHIGVEFTLLHGVVHPPVAPHAGHVMVGHMAVEQEVPRQLLAQAGSAFGVQVEGLRRSDHLDIHPVRLGAHHRILDRPVLGREPERHLVAGPRATQPADRPAVRMV